MKLIERYVQTGIGGDADEIHAIYRKGKQKLCIEFYL